MRGCACFDRGGGICDLRNACKCWRHNIAPMSAASPMAAMPANLDTENREVVRAMVADSRRFIGLSGRQNKAALVCKRCRLFLRYAMTPLLERIGTGEVREVRHYAAGAVLLSIPN